MLLTILSPEFLVIFLCWPLTVVSDTGGKDYQIYFTVIQPNQDPKSHSRWKIAECCSKKIKVEPRRKMFMFVFD